MYEKKPDWLKIKITGDSSNNHVEQLMSELALNTICLEANCPNRMECYNKKTATFLILGRICTRNCRFCNVTKGKPAKIDSNEPENIANAVKRLELKHVVITSVTRDDLPDGGAQHYVNVINAIRSMNSGVTIEVLIPDFGGNWEALKLVVYVKPDIINHNVETVPSLYQNVRPMAIYARSIELLHQVKEFELKTLTKSGLMLGLGETKAEVEKVMIDLLNAKCNILTLGQYLAPSKDHIPVKEYIHPDIFRQYKYMAMELGFNYVASGPLVRSSYQSGEILQTFTDGIKGDN